MIDYNAKQRAFQRVFSKYAKLYENAALWMRSNAQLSMSSSVTQSRGRSVILYRSRSVAPWICSNAQLDQNSNVPLWMKGIARHFMTQSMDSNAVQPHNKGVAVFLINNAAKCGDSNLEVYQGNNARMPILVALNICLLTSQFQLIHICVFFVHKRNSYFLPN